MKTDVLLKDLAAVFRWTARLNMHEGIANHFSIKLDQEDNNNNNNSFYINRPGQHFSKMKASDLLLVNENDIDMLRDRPDIIDPTAVNIHGTIHSKVKDANCILHCHSKYATILSTFADMTLPPIDQNTMRYFNRITYYDDFDGMGFMEESEKMAASMNNSKRGGKTNNVMLMANHGVLTIGKNVAEAFDHLYYFEKSCETYITALQTRQPLNVVSDAVAEKTALDWENYPTDSDQLHLNAIRSILDMEDETYKS